MQTKIRPCRSEFLFKINKHACISIWYTRVVIYGYLRKKILLLSFPKIELCGWSGGSGPFALEPPVLLALHIWQPFISSLILAPFMSEAVEAS